MQKIIARISWSSLMQIIIPPLFLALLLSLQGCFFPGVYKINIQQGNIITQEMLKKLKPGMTRRQVHFVLGNPVLKNTFDDKIEHYIYTYQKAGGDDVQQTVTIYYDKDSYLRYEGDLLSENPAY